MNFDRNTSKRIEDIIHRESIERNQYETSERLKHISKILKRNDYDQLSDSEALRIASTLQIEAAKIRAMYQLNDKEFIERIAFDVNIQAIGG